MTREVEERIVAMYFNNDDFEKNAKQTIETLGQLKEGLDLEDSVKGFETLDKAGKQLNLNRATQSVNNFKKAASGIKDVLKKGLDIGTAPLKPLMNLFNTFEDYTKKFIGFDLAGKFVNQIESIVRSFTTAPISAGWSMYQRNIDSVQTIMSGTKLSYTRAMQKQDANWVYDEAEHLDYVKKNLADLTEYANQTVYSLEDMTNNVGKFTNQGVELEDAVTAMEGIANATAKAGQGAQQASMAMYNISQAIGVGKMTSIDWKSIENANIATEELKTTFIETAAAAGKLVKEVDKAGKEHYYALVGEGKKQKKEEITAENFRDTLQHDWLDKETMMRVFQIYSGKNIDAATMESWGLSKEQIEKYMQMGKEAKEAATQVRTFDKMMDALTESVQSSWATSFEYIFGDVKEATALWSSLNNVIDGILSNISDTRNKVLLEWRGMEKDENGALKKIAGAHDGREDLRVGFFVLIDVVKQLANTFSGAWSKVFGGLTGKKLQEITAGFRKFANSLQSWLGKADQSGSRLNKIRKGLQGVFSILKVVINRVKSTISYSLKYIAPLADVVIEVFSTVFGFFDGIHEMDPSQIFVKIGEGLSKLFEKVKNLFSGKGLLANLNLGSLGELPIVKWLRDAYSSVANTVSGIADDLGLGAVGDWLSSAWQFVVDTWNGIKDGAAKALDGIGSFLSTPIEWLKTIFPGIKTVAETVGSAIAPISSPVWEFIEGVWNGVKNAYDTTIGKAKEELPKLGEFFSNPLQWIKDTFFEATGAVSGAAGSVADAFGDLSDFDPMKALDTISFEDTGVYKWFSGIFDVISALFGPELPGWATETVNSIKEFFAEPWEWIRTHIPGLAGVVDSLFTAPDDGHDGKIGLVVWFEGVFENIKTFWDSTVGNYLGTIEDIGSFLSDTWGWIKKQLGIEDSDDDTPDFVERKTVKLGSSIDKVANGLKSKENETPGFVVWLQNIWSSIESFWNDTIGSSEAQAIINGIGDFLSNAWGWTTDAVSTAWEFMTKPNEDGETGFIAWIKGVWSSIESFWNDTIGSTEAQAIINGVGDFLNNAWGWTTDAVSTAWEFMTKPNEDGETGFIAWIKGVWSSIESFWNDTIGSTEAQAIINGVGDFLSNAWGWTTDAISTAWEFMTKPNEDGEIGIVTLLKSVWGSISDFWTNTIMANAESILRPVGEFLSDTWGWIKKKFGLGYSKEDVPIKLAIDEAKLSGGSTSDYMPNEPEEPPFITWIKNAAHEIERIWDEYFVKDSLGVFGAIGSFLSDAWGWIESLFVSSASAEGETESAEGDVQKVGKIGGKIVGVYNQALETVKGAFSDSPLDAADEIKGTKSMTVFERIINKIRDFLETIKTFVFKVTEKVELSSLEGFFDGLGRLINGIFTVLGEVFGALGDFISGNGSFTDVLASVKELILVGIIPLLVDVVGRFAQLGVGVLGKAMGVQFTSIGAEIRDVAIGIAVVIGSIVAMKTVELNEDDVKNYGRWILAAAGLLVVVVAVIAAVKKMFKQKADEQGEDKDHPVADFANNFLKSLEKVAIIWVVMDKLPQVLRAAGDAKAAVLANGGDSYADDLMKAVLAIFGAAMAVAAVIELFGLLNEKIGIGIGATQSAALVVVEAIAIVLGALWAVNKMFSDVQEAKDMAEKAKSIGDAIGGIFGGLVEGLMNAIGKGLYTIQNGETREETSEREMREFNNMIDQFIKIGEVLSVERMTTLSGLLERFTQMGQQFTFDNTEFSSLFSLESFRGFASGFGVFVTSLVEILGIFAPTGSDLGADEIGEARAKRATEMLDFFKDETFLSVLTTMFDLMPTVIRPLASIDFDKNSVDEISEWSAKFREFIDNGGFTDFFGVIQDIFRVMNEKIVGTNTTKGIEYSNSEFEKYTKVIDLVTKISIFYDTMQKLSQRRYDFNYDRENTANKRSLFVKNFGSMLTEMDNAILEFEKHPTLNEAINMPQLDAVEAILGLFDLLANGIGSDTWANQFKTFKRFIGDEEAMEEYIGAIESIYERLKNSELGKDQGITFDGLKIVSNLFDAIQDGFNNTTDIPQLNAQPLIDYIVTAFSGGKDKLVRAIHEMIQAGIDESVNKDVADYSNVETDIITNAGKIIEMINQLKLGSEEGGLLGGFNVQDLIKNLGLGDLTEMFSSKELEDAMGALKNNIPTIDVGDFINFKIEDPTDPTQTVDMVTYLQGQIATIQQSLEEAGEIPITLVPTFDLTALTPEALQSQLASQMYKIPATVDLPNMNISYELLRNELEIDALKQKLDTIAMKLESWGSQNYSGTVGLGAHIDGVSRTISGLRLYLDTGLLVGGITPLIDQKLARKSWLYEKTGVVPMISAN